MLVALACSRGAQPVPVPDAGPALAQEHEPNDSQAQANELPAGVAMHGTFASRTDTDWFRFPLSDAGVAARIDVFSDGGASLTVHDASSILAAFRGPQVHVRDLSLSLGDAGAYWLELKGTPGPYVLQASLETGPPDLEQEPNDDAAHANALGEDGTASGRLFPAGDQDWFVVRASEASVLRAQAGPGVELAVVGEDGGVLAKTSDVVSDLGIAPGDTFLRLTGEASESLYKLSAEVWTDDGSIEREPNDSLASSQLLSLPIALTGHLWPRKDVDLFRFHLGPNHRPISITVDPPRNLPMQLRLLQLHGTSTEIIGATSANPPQLISVPLPEGDFAIELSSREASAVDPYELHVSP